VKLKSFSNDGSKTLGPVPIVPSIRHSQKTEVEEEGLRQGQSGTAERLFGGVVLGSMP
jgi:hypothetical protein